MKYISSIFLSLSLLSIPSGVAYSFSYIDRDGKVCYSDDPEGLSCPASNRGYRWSYGPNYTIKIMNKDTVEIKRIGSDVGHLFKGELQGKSSSKRNTHRSWSTIRFKMSRGGKSWSIVIEEFYGYPDPDDNVVGSVYGNRDYVVVTVTGENGTWEYEYE